MSYISPSQLSPRLRVEATCPLLFSVGLSAAKYK